MGATEAPCPHTVTALLNALSWVWPWYSETFPKTRTTSPVDTSSWCELKTKTASEVARSPSPFKSWR